MAVRGSLKGRKALVTGAAKRLGRAVALALAEEGVSVVVHYGASSQEAEALCGLIGEKGVAAWTLGGDLSSPDVAESLMRRAVDAAGPIDILINSASTFPEDGLRDVTAASLVETATVNAISPLLISRVFVELTEKGDIVNFLDGRMHDYDREHAGYHLSKRMLFSLTRMMALEFAPGVKVNGVAPGLILPPEGEDESYLERLASTNPLARYGDPLDVTRAVLYLLMSDFVTGQVLYVDGGRHMKGKVYG